MKTQLYSVCIFFLSLLYEIQAIQYAPTWISSSYIDSGQYAIISVLTGSASTPNYEMIYTSAFSTIPNAGYGISQY